MPKRIIEATHLRRYTNISKVKKEKQKDISSHDAKAQFEQQKKIFMEYEFDEQEFQMFQLKIIDAAKEGKYEIEVMEFTSAFCSDGGRAINNGEKDWPRTLQGKARNFHSLWQEHGRPNGYRLKAKVTSYPQGFIGDISLLIDWS